ncbi:MAG: C45 family autoproteolytic acyltransferase/hydrolase, partial [Promethearchaeia archaeon]
PPTLANHIIFRRLQPEGEKYATLGSGVGGLAGNNNGINDRGLSIVYNYAYPLEIGKSGVPPMFLIREILEQCDSVKGSVELLEQFPRLGGANIMIADKNGDLAVVETSSDRIEVRREGENGEKDFLICTNHYISPKMKENEVPRNSVYTENAPEYLQGKPVHKSSILRYKSAYEILKNQGLGTVTLDYLNQNIQCNHGPENKPSEYTFCNHGEQISTGFGVMIDVHNKEFYAIFGKPCQGEMQNLSQHL